MKLKINSCDGIYSNSLDVRFGRQCDNNCAFCIEKNGINAKELNVEKMIESTIESKKTSVLILGGEPLLCMEKVLQYINGIKNYINEIYLTTSLPQVIYEKWNIFNEICENLTGLNISIQHFDSEKNNAIFNSNVPFNRIELLKKILNTNIAKKVRVSINLVKGAIDNREDVIKCVNQLDNWGCVWLKINELQDATNLYVSFRKLFPELKHKSPYSHGCQYDINVFNTQNMRVTLKECCFLTEETNKATLSDLVKVIIKRFKKKKPTYNNVLYEDGTLENAWLKGDK